MLWERLAARSPFNTGQNSRRDAWNGRSKASHSAAIAGKSSSVMSSILKRIAAGMDLELDGERLSRCLICNKHAYAENEMNQGKEVQEPTFQIEFSYVGTWGKYLPKDQKPNPSSVMVDSAL